MMLLTGIVLCIIGKVRCADEIPQIDEIVPVIGNTTVDMLNPVPPALAIVSGMLAYPGQHPHQAAVRMVSASGSVSGCGAVVVHRDWLLTAAHCTTRGVTIVVRAGLVNMTTPSYFLETTEWYQHPTYDDTKPNVIQPNDISIIKVPRPLPFTRMLRSIRLQRAAAAYRDHDQEVMYVSGFGRVWTGGVTSEDLHWVYLRAISNAECLRTFGNIVTDTIICAKYFDVVSQSPCQGDNGGGLVQVSASGEPVLIGISVFMAGGDDGCHSGHPAGFLRVGAYHEWLTEATGVDFQARGDQIQDLEDVNNLQINVKVNIKLNGNIVGQDIQQIVAQM